MFHKTVLYWNQTEILVISERMYFWHLWNKWSSACLEELCKCCIWCCMVVEFETLPPKDIFEAYWSLYHIWDVNKCEDKWQSLGLIKFALFTLRKFQTWSHFHPNNCYKFHIPNETLSNVSTYNLLDRRFHDLNISY